MKLRIASLGLLLSIVFFLSSCGNDDEGKKENKDDFNRSELLENWADNIIIPGYEAYISSLDQLVESKDVFIQNGQLDNLNQLRASYLSAYKKWQHVAMFEIGRAETITLTNYTNAFPTDEVLIENNLSSESYNLALPSNIAAQGFPALDYLLYGLGNSEGEVLTKLKESRYSNYLSDVIQRLHTLSSSVLNDWKTGYRATFLNANGSSGTASVDKLVNDFLFYYEKHLRAGKIGIPAGVFSGSTIAEKVEAPYSEEYSKELFLEGFHAMVDFFKGTSYDGNSTGVSLNDYISHVSKNNGTSDVSGEILAQWMEVDKAADKLSASLKDQVSTDNIKMLQTYDELQKVVALLKVDMLQALNIQVDYVDADDD